MHFFSFLFHVIPFPYSCFFGRDSLLSFFFLKGNIKHKSLIKQNHNNTLINLGLFLVAAHFSFISSCFILYIFYIILFLPFVLITSYKTSTSNLLHSLFQQRTFFFLWNIFRRSICLSAFFLMVLKSFAAYMTWLCIHNTNGTAFIASATVDAVRRRSGVRFCLMKTSPEAPHRQSPGDALIDIAYAYMYTVYVYKGFLHTTYYYSSLYIYI